MVSLIYHPNLPHHISFNGGPVPLVVSSMQAGMNSFILHNFGGAWTIWKHRNSFVLNGSSPTFERFYRSLGWVTVVSHGQGQRIETRAGATAIYQGQLILRSFSELSGKLMFWAIPDPVVCRRPQWASDCSPTSALDWPRHRADHVWVLVGHGFACRSIYPCLWSGANVLSAVYSK
jgi:hypothetical protein